LRGHVLLECHGVIHDTTVRQVCGGILGYGCSGSVVFGDECHYGNEAYYSEDDEQEDKEGFESTGHYNTFPTSMAFKLSFLDILTPPLHTEDGNTESNEEHD
jgi:hypothetical protein